MSEYYFTKRQSIMRESKTSREPHPGEKPQSREAGFEEAGFGKLEFIRGACSNYVFNYLRKNHSDTPESLVGISYERGTPGVAGVYGFVGIVERYDESMVMLSFLLRIPLSDVLYLRSKESTMRGLVRHPSLAEEDPNVRAYVAGEEFNTSNALDYELHAAASAELDRRWRSSSSSSVLSLQVLAGP